MNLDEHHVAFPKLYGAPAYGRPPRSVQPVERPDDPDSLPLEAYSAWEDPAVAPVAQELASWDEGPSSGAIPEAEEEGGAFEASGVEREAGPGAAEARPGHDRRNPAIRALGRLLSGR